MSRELTYCSTKIAAREGHQVGAKTDLSSGWRPCDCAEEFAFYWLTENPHFSQNQREMGHPLISCVEWFCSGMGNFSENKFAEFDARH